MCVGGVHRVHSFPIRTAYHMIGVECGENYNGPLVGSGVMYKLMGNRKDVSWLAGREPMLHPSMVCIFFGACPN